MPKRKKKRHTPFSTTKRFPYPSAPAALSSDSSSETVLPEEEEIIGVALATSLKTTPTHKVTSIESEEDETELKTEMVGRTGWDMVWHLRKVWSQLNLYILFPFIYVVAIGISGQLRTDTYQGHLLALTVIYIIIFIGKFLG